MNFWAPSRFRKGWLILFQDKHSDLTLFLVQQKTKKVNKHFEIGRQFHDSTTCQNEMMHTLVINKV